MATVAPVLLGIAPFGLVAGMASVEAGLRLVDASAFSLALFAGAAQLASLELIGGGAPAWVAIMTAVAINLRLAMYSASMASFMTREPLRRRALMTYVLVDQAYALSVDRFRREGEGAGDRFWFFLGTAMPLWVTWQSATIVGVVAGGVVPEGMPLGFAVPLSFLCLLVPAVTDRPTLAAAVTGGTVALLGADLPANLGMPAGAVTGVVVGALVARRLRAWT